MRVRGYARGGRDANEVLKKCEGDINLSIALSKSLVDIDPHDLAKNSPEEGQKLQACYDAFKTFVEYYGSYRYGPEFILPSSQVDQYLGDARRVHPQAAELPVELLNDAEFIRLTEKELPAVGEDAAKLASVFGRIKKALARINPDASALMYDSRHFSAPLMVKTDMGRLLIYYPQKGVDRWIQLGVPRQRPSGTNFSLVSVVKQDGAGRPLSPYQAYFQDFVRKDPGRSSSFMSRQERTGTPIDCANCHNNGPNLIVPSPTHPPDAEGRGTLAQLNAVIEGYGAPTQPGFAPRRRAGAPQLGMNIPRDPEFIRSCAHQVAPALKEESLHRVASSMRCANCHDGGVRAPLQVEARFYDPEKFRNEFIYSVVVHGKAMPPGSSLNEEERKALVHCLMSEVADSKHGDGMRDGPMIQWMKSLPCELAKPAPEPFRPQAETRRRIKPFSEWLPERTGGKTGESGPAR